MMKIDAKNRANRKSDWIVDRTTTNAERKDKVESYQDDVRVEKNKMIESSSQRTRTMYDTDQTNENEEDEKEEDENDEEDENRTNALTNFLRWITKEETNQILMLLMIKRN